MAFFPVWQVLSHIMSVDSFSHLILVATLSQRRPKGGDASLLDTSLHDRMLFQFPRELDCSDSSECSVYVSKPKHIKLFSASFSSL